MKNKVKIEIYFNILNKLKYAQKEPLTIGLKDSTIESFLLKDENLREAITEANNAFERLEQVDPKLISMSEANAITYLQKDIENFYPSDSIQPYIPLTAAGPWVITTSGAVVYDTGGYGMLGLGHSPELVMTAMAQKQVMANIMTPSLWHRPFIEKLEQEIGKTRKKCPFDHFLFLNSGSEAVAVAARLSDLNAKKQTDKGGTHSGQTIKILSLEGGFHGRTQRAAQASDSTMKYYKFLASFRDRKNLLTVPPNDIKQLKNVFEQAKKENVFIEAMFMEPVMGEGDPGKSITPEFYREARRLTQENHTLLLVDSIQAAIRAKGCLSIVDYPGFEKEDAPDMETYSKAINAGQFPLSVLAIRGNLYKKGIYGNTMTSNPRAMAVGISVLNSITEEIRRNIVEKGKEAVEKLSKLKEELGDAILKVQGTGLLFSVHFSSDQYKASGLSSLEEIMRKHGINVIHGGKNALRFTPHFKITSDEIDLIVNVLREAILLYPTRPQ